MPKEIRQIENSFAVDRLKNQAAGGEGSIIPPPLRGATRIPIASSLRVLRTQVTSTGTRVTLAFDEPTSPTIQVSHYNVFINPLEDNSNFSIVSVKRSPAIFEITTSEEKRFSLNVQTVLKNGQTSDLTYSPSTAVKTTALV